MNRIGGKKRARNEARRLAAAAKTRTVSAEVHRKHYPDGRVGLRLVFEGRVLQEMTAPDEESADRFVASLLEAAAEAPL